LPDELSAPLSWEKLTLIGLRRFLLGFRVLSKGAKHMAQTDVVSLTSTTRKAFITAGISLAFLPISGFIGYYIGKMLQAPKPRIEYAQVVVDRTPRQIDPKLVAALRSDSHLLYQLRNVVSASDPDFRCRRWLDGESWSDKCSTIVEDAVSHSRSYLAFQITNTELQRKNVESRLRQSYDDGIASMKRSQAIVESLSQEFRRWKTDPLPPPTGNVQFLVGVLNSGDSEGVIIRKGFLRFLETEIPILTERYTVVKAHSIEEIPFSLDRAKAEPDAIKSWEKLVKSNTQERFKIAVSDGEKEFVTDARLPP
jgi:hypothetical protein